ncbi:MAG TPA: type II toxin-antitoxin system Phd/YefM family antitoxin [Hydrogenophaga sp.]|uniref:type II toxin-antitoxin system Phd/YefM family antitoxin n=1 Tax=Hydrogenophaga sp. TaxID=1904254 RepID=UPI002C2A49D0|nr:type II toxin-antitoxin system Phd/YefM family antitoxin [Hydrogenophaga sp.]HSX91594.1 type II toxin-antitoxin system Phd/YefM family antitoxin [Hydrogenophaga sp.]
MLEVAAREPVAIERHKKVKAIVCSPEVFQGRSDRDGQLAERRAARAAQALVDKDRLIKHQRLAIDLVLMSQSQREALIARARMEVERWRRERLCSEDYIARWDALLGLPVEELARAMASESPEWGVALRQNSPWLLVTP